MIITIDGPTASGKSTMGRMLADAFGFHYLNSGALYRALAYLLMEKRGYDLEQLKNPRSEDVAYFFSDACLTYAYDARGEHVFYENHDLWPLLKSSVIDKAASVVSMNQAVRDQLLIFQRTFAQSHDVIVDGRDCGSVVFPHADVKFFLKARLLARATRWQLAQEQRGVRFALPEAEQKIAERDVRDSEREIAPLIVPDGAIVIDNSSLNIEQTFDDMKKIIKEKMSTRK